MKTFTFTPEGTTDCSVRARIHGLDESGTISEKLYPAVLICPGGGYDHISERESDPVADVFYAAGYNTFILKYSVEENARNLRPLCELAGAMAQIRKNKEEWHTPVHLYFIYNPFHTHSRMCDPDSADFFCKFRMDFKFFTDTFHTLPFIHPFYDLLYNTGQIFLGD